MNSSRLLLGCALAALFTLIGCASSNQGGMMKESGPRMAAMDASAMHGPAEPARAVIKSANVEIEVREPTASADIVRQMVVREGGTILHSHSSDEQTVRLNVNVPEARLEAFVDEVAAMGKLVSKSISSQDVTEQMVDMEARLSNLYALRDRYRTLLQRADQVSDMVEIERRLAEVQSQIDSIEARRKYLSDQVAYSQVYITIKQQTVYGPLGYVATGIGWAIKKLFVWN